MIESNPLTRPTTGQCQIFVNEFMLLNQVTFESYFLDILSSITCYLSNDHFSFFLDLAGGKRKGWSNIVLIKYLIA